MLIYIVTDISVYIQMKMEAGGVLSAARLPSTARDDASCERRKPVTVMKMMMMMTVMMMKMIYIMVECISVCVSVTKK